MTPSDGCRSADADSPAGAGAAVIAGGALTPAGVSLAERLSLLERLPYLAVLAPAARRAIAAALVVRSYRAGEVLVIEDDPCPGLLIVRSGRLKASLLSPGGREHILDIFGPGEAVNEAEALAGIPSATTIAALDDASVLVVGCAALTPLRDQLTPAARAAVQALGGRCRHLVTVVADLSLRPVTARLARLLLDYATQPQRPTLTRGQMAAHLGTVREMVSRSLRDLERSGLVRIDKGQIVIVERQALERLAERC